MVHKYKKFLINILLSLWINYVLNFIQFGHHLILHQRSLKLSDNLMIFGEISKDIQIT
jgi:hypothetical protein